MGGWEPLQLRRKIARVTMIHKIANGQAAISDQSKRFCSWSNATLETCTQNHYKDQLEQKTAG